MEQEEEEEEEVLVVLVVVKYMMKQKKGRTENKEARNYANNHPNKQTTKNDKHFIFLFHAVLLCIRNGLFPNINSYLDLM